MWRFVLAFLVVIMTTQTTQAQFFFWNWDDDKPNDEIRSGGPKPYIEPILPEHINFPNTLNTGTILIDLRGRQLFLIHDNHTALHYPIAVGKQGFSWQGSEKISRKAEWPDWHPPEEMRERVSDLPYRMTGGIKNPLGAAALYLGNTLYRIHGTNDPSSIGTASSSGCFRMQNGSIVDLASRVEVGAEVRVVTRLPADLEQLVASQVRPFRRDRRRAD